MFPAMSTVAVPSSRRQLFGVPEILLIKEGGKETSAESMVEQDFESVTVCK